MRGVAAHLVQRRRGVDIPEDLERMGRGVARDPLDQLGIEHADPARLDDDVGVGRFGKNTAQPLGRRRVHHRSRIGGRLDVAMLMPIERVRFVEDDIVAMPRQRRQDAAVIGRRPVPIGGQQAGAVESDLHAGTPVWRLAATASSSSARWVQVWRARIVSSPEAIKDRRKAGSSRIAFR